MDTGPFVAERRLSMRLLSSQATVIRRGTRGAALRILHASTVRQYSKYFVLELLTSLPLPHLSATLCRPITKLRKAFEEKLRVRERPCATTLQQSTERLLVALSLTPDSCLHLAIID
jgi:hypothetical protein